MKQAVILVIGAGRCGMMSLQVILNKQAGVQVSYEEPPYLPWNRPRGERTIRERFARFRRQRKAEILGDVASFYLPYLDDAIAVEPDIRIVCLRRPREEVVASFCEWLDSSHPLPTNHWATRPAPGWHHDPHRSRIYPKYDTQNRHEGIRRYWDEYYGQAESLSRKYPEYLRVVDTYETINTEQGLREVLTFLGIPSEQQVPAVGTHVHGTPEPPPRSWARRSAGNPMDPRRCAVLVPFTGHIVPSCERGLQELERRGYEVRRVVGFAAIDQGRNQMATDALLDGYEETLWIDSDVEFHPDSVDRLRSHGLPIVCGIYPQKGKRAIACHIMPGTPQLVFGRDGGLIELLYAGTGFLLVRREVYLTIQETLRLPMCNERFDAPMIPFFHPMLHEIDDGHWYLAEDYAFSERARQCGFKIMADTTIRLWHVGGHAFGWEDAGTDRPKYDTFTINFGPKPEESRFPWESPELASFAARHPWPAERPVAPAIPERATLAPEVCELLRRSIGPQADLAVEIGSGAASITTFLVEHFSHVAVIAIARRPAPWERQGNSEACETWPQSHEALCAEFWGHRKRLVLVESQSVDGLREVHQAGLRPSVVCLHASQNLECFSRDLAAALEIYPQVPVVGYHWNQQGVQAAVRTVLENRGFDLETLGSGWRIVRCPTA
jgi:hypothetical protein